MGLLLGFSIGHLLGYSIGHYGKGSLVSAGKHQHPLYILFEVLLIDLFKVMLWLNMFMQMKGIKI